VRIAKAVLGLIMIIFIFCSGCNRVRQDSTKELTLSAAASLREPLEEIVKQYENNTGIKVNMNFGGSGSLQKQIEQGAPVDIIISAGKSQIDALIDKGIANKSSYKELLNNTLVLIVSNNYDKNIKSIESLKDKDIRLAIGEVATVPVGQYSKEFLQNVKLWEGLRNNIVYAKDVKAVLNYVEKGEAEAGIVYYSDAVNLKNSYIAYRIPEDTHSPILYPMVVIEQSKNKTDAMDFIKFIGRSQTKEVFKKYNFGVKEN
jgi:molybdate transport system substrate-binding protein